VQAFDSLRGGVIAALGADGQLAVAFGFGFDHHLAKAAGAPGVGGFVADGVLVADVAGNGATDLVDFIERLGKEGNASGVLGDNFERAAGAFGMLFFAQDSDGVDGGSILRL